MKTLEAYAFCAFGLSGAPTDKMGMYVTAKQDDQPKPLASWTKQSYWALSADPIDDYPSVLMHIYYEGDLPSERDRDMINRQVQWLTGKLLFGLEK